MSGLLLLIELLVSPIVYFSLSFFKSCRSSWNARTLGLVIPILSLDECRSRKQHCILCSTKPQSFFILWAVCYSFKGIFWMMVNTFLFFFQSALTLCVLLMLNWTVPIGDRARRGGLYFFTCCLSVVHQLFNFSHKKNSTDSNSTDILSILILNIFL